MARLSTIFMPKENLQSSPQKLLLDAAVKKKSLYGELLHLYDKSKTEPSFDGITYSCKFLHFVLLILDCCEEAMAPMKACSIDIDPEDIDVSDTATFVWELA